MAYRGVHEDIGDRPPDLEVVWMKEARRNHPQQVGQSELAFGGLDTYCNEIDRRSYDDQCLGDRRERGPDDLCFLSLLHDPYNGCPTPKSQVRGIGKEAPGKHFPVVVDFLLGFLLYCTVFLPLFHRRSMHS